MATDATGTPTPKGIPKYNPDADAPSGLGFNAAMDAIDALLLTLTGGKVSLASLAQGGATSGQALLWNGTAWAPGAPAGSVTMGTALPGSPTDGQEFILVNSTTDPAFVWHLRYNAGSTSAHKWECIGGSPAQSFVGAGVAIQGDLSYTNHSGPSVTVPVAGDYDITIEGTVAGWGDDTATTGYINYAVGGTAPLDEDAAHWGMKTVQEVLDLTVRATRRKTGVAASSVIQERTRVTRTPAGVTWTLQNRRLSVMPKRVG